MRYKAITSFIIIVIIGFLFINCDDNLEKNPINNKVTYNSGCKGEAMKNSTSDTTNIFNKYVNANTLFIEKTNWIYPCIHDSLQIRSLISHDTLTIYESWLYASNCDCLRDVHYQINNIPKGKYVVKLMYENRNSNILNPDSIFVSILKLDTTFNINIQ